ncbi:ParA/MinD ATPase-like protein [Helicosporidium sp. ATCC 50920]|nr:ParA/MinD ATPase-like protein [Helicosporidium sp. ATCC 50920]|eukprot:KDD77038.1 ParA/MinD ATPase-like protein [Helicosporidium sp. ATCC 50920]
MAVSMSRTLGLRVGILDADVSGPSIGQMMGVSGKPAVDSEGLMIPPEAFGVKCMSTALLLPPTGAAFWRGPMVMSALETMMRNVAWRPLDVLLVDMPPGTGDAQLTVCQRLHLTGAVIVSTPQEVALQDARRGVSAFAAARVPVLGMVQNMSLHVCEQCGHESHIFGGGGVQEAAESAGVPLLGDVPLQMDVRESGDAGAPVAASEADSPAVKAYRDMAKKVWEGCIAKQ